MGKTPGVTKAVDLALMRVEIFDQDKAHEICLALVRTGFEYSHGGEFPSATLAVC